MRCCNHRCASNEDHRMVPGCAACIDNLLTRLFTDVGTHRVPHLSRRGDDSVEHS
jgi:hypothetical protein